MSIGIRRTDHLAMAVWSVDEQIPFLRDVLGMEITGRFRAEDQGYAGVTLAFPGGGIEFELIEPLREERFVARFLRRLGPGLHHLTVQVEGVVTAAADLRARGIEPFGGVRGTGGSRETFIYPRDSGGVRFQLVDPAGSA